MIWLEFPPHIPCLKSGDGGGGGGGGYSLPCCVGLGCLDSILTVSGPDLAMRKLIFLDPAAPQARQYSDLGQHQHNTNITQQTDPRQL